MSAEVVESIVRAVRPSSEATEKSSPFDVMRARLLSRADLPNLPKPEPLINGTLDKGTVTLLAGYHSTGKSFIALDWACSIATGRPWQGRPTTPGRVLYIASEGADGLDRRVSAWEYAWRLQVDDLDVLPMPVQIAEQAQQDALLQLVTGRNYRLVVIDTLARCAVGMDENSARDMGLMVDAADRLRRAERLTVLLVHHTGKDKTTIRGSSALEAGADTVYTTEGDGGCVHLTRTKRKDGPLDDLHVLRVKPNDTGSCHVESVRGAADMLGSEDKLMSAYLSAFDSTGASKAELRSIADMPPASFHRALTGLVKRGQLVNHGTDARPFYKQRSEQ